MACSTPSHPEPLYRFANASRLLYAPSTSPEPVMTHAQSPSWFVIRSKATADIGYDALVPTVIFTALALVMVILRLCSRTCSNPSRIGLEDYFITAALVSVSVDITKKITLTIVAAVDRLHGSHWARHAFTRVD